MSKDRCSGGMVYHYLVNDAKVRLFFQTKYEIAGFNKTLTHHRGNHFIDANKKVWPLLKDERKFGK
jgi:hypothetical protein